MTDAVSRLKALADENRLQILAMLAREDCYVELIAARLSLSEATACYHLKKLEKAGFLRTSRSQFYVLYSLRREALDTTLAEMILPAENTPPPPERDAAYRAEILRHFFRDGRLTALPSQQKKREIVYRHIAEKLEFGRDYSEAEISEVIRAFHEDYCTIRRDMVEFGILSRTREIYRREK